MANKTQNLLKAINVFYLLVSIILIAVGAYGLGQKSISSVTITGGIVACGVFLFLLAIIGFIGGARAHPTVLNVYMGLLAIVFIIQFSISVAALAITDDQQKTVLSEAWIHLSDETKMDVQDALTCCGFFNLNTTDPYGPGPNCTKAQLNGGTCFGKMEADMDKGLKAAGGVGLFFAFTQLVGIGLAHYLKGQPLYK
eukprot:Colp12_sorted_trinity150504_noHs@2130